MDEARRFLRYIIPGALFAIETALFLVLFLPHPTIEKLAELNNRGFGVAVGAILGSGGIGFLLSAVHHWLYWNRPQLWGGIDHRTFIEQLQNDQILTITGGQPHTPMEAWTIVTGLWHERVGAHCRSIQAANPRADSLANLVHSTGTAKVGYFSAVFSAALILFYVSWPNTVLLTEYKRWVLAAAGMVTVLLVGWIHLAAYRDTLKIAQHVAQQVLADALGDENNAQTHFWQV
jgi:hypothetical protein